MQILSEIPTIVSDSHALDQYWSNTFPLSVGVINQVNELIIGDRTVVMYSGSPRLQFDATYIESPVFANLPIAWHQKTLFIDHKNKNLINYVIKKLQPSTLLILNANNFIRYRLWSDILHDIQAFKKISNQVIVTMPIDRFDFNRLRFTEEEIVLKLNGILVDRTVVICQ